MIIILVYIHCKPLNIHGIKVDDLKRLTYWSNLVLAFSLFNCPSKLLSILIGATFKRKKTAPYEEHIISFKSNPFYDEVPSMFKHTLKFKSCVLAIRYQ